MDKEKAATSRANEEIEILNVEDTEDTEVEVEAHASPSNKCVYDLTDMSLTKLEILSASEPLVVIFHDILSEARMTRLREAARDGLEPPKTVSASTGSIRSTSSRRSGKVAFLSPLTASEEDKVSENGLYCILLF